MKNKANITCNILQGKKIKPPFFKNKMITTTVENFIKFSSKYELPAVSLAGTFEKVATSLLIAVVASELAFRTIEKLQQIPTNSTAEKFYYLTISITWAELLFSFREGTLSIYRHQLTMTAIIAVSIFLVQTRIHWTTLAQQQATARAHSSACPSSR